MGEERGPFRTLGSHPDTGDGLECEYLPQQVSDSSGFRTRGTSWRTCSTHDRNVSGPRVTGSSSSLWGGSRTLLGEVCLVRVWMTRVHRGLDRV